MQRNSLYYDSGIRQNDVIVSVDGRHVRNDRDFYDYIRPGARVPVIILRDGRQQTIYITSNQNRDWDDRGNSERRQFSYDASQGSQAYLGVRFESRVRDGAIVSSVTSGSPADEAGLQRGDEIVAINGREVQSPSEVTRIVASMHPRDTIDIDFSRRIDERTQAVLQSRETASVGQYRQEVYRGGPNYQQSDDVEYQRSYSDGQMQPERRFDRDGELAPERRNARPLLPRLRD